MVSALDKFGTLCEDVTTLAQLLSAFSHQSKEHEPLKTEVAPNNNTNSMAAGTLQIRLIIHKISTLSSLSLKKNAGIFV